MSADAESTALAVPNTTERIRQATDVAGVCKAIVLKTVNVIQGKKYVRVEGWQSIATAHGCVASARDVERTQSGFRAVGEIRRADNGVVIATAEGFVGDDETTWAKRPEYARRAMAQTRAISRACRSAFAHVVVLMEAGLETTPAEEVPLDGFKDPKLVSPSTPEVRPAIEAQTTPVHELDWRSFVVPRFIKKYAGRPLGDMASEDLNYWADNYQPKPFRGELQQADLDFRRALTEGKNELAKSLVSAGAAPADEDAPF